MLLVKQTEHVAKILGDKTAVKMFKEAGFDALDYSMFSMGNPEDILCGDGYKAYIEDLRAYADSLGISFCQGHAPFPSYNYQDIPFSEQRFSIIVRCLEISAMLGITHLVIHPVQLFDPAEDRKEVNMAFYKKLLPYAKEYNVKMCLENMWGWDKKRSYIIPDTISWAKDFADYIDTLDSPYLTACLDLGHCGLIGEDAECAIRILGHDRLAALHVHDNDHIHDTHTLPYYGKMDWNAICQALHDIDYTGNFTYEADNFLVPLPKDETVLLAASRMMEAVGRYLIDKIDL